MTIDEKYILISKKLAGELTEAESIEFDNWLNDSKKNRARYKLMKTVWQVDYVNKKKEKEDDLFAKILDEINEEPKVVKLNSRFGFKHILKYAAAISLLLMSGWIISEYSDILSDDSSEQHISFTEKRNPVGIQKSNVLLPDGSKVALNGNSYIKYPEELDGPTREIELVGEAYFEVAKDKNRPFIIKSENLVTTAVGTAFNVRAYSDDAIMQVAVTEGEVKINSIDSPDILYHVKPGSKLTFEKQGEKVSIYSFDQVDELAWLDGVIYFHDASMFEVIRKLERWYNIEIEIIGTSDHTWQYSAEYKNEILENIIMGLAYSQHFAYEMKEDKVIIKLHKN